MGRKKWSKEKIFSEILTLHRDEKPLNDSYINKNYNPLYNAARRFFGSWKNAIEAAGLDYNKIRELAESKRIEKVSKWSKQRIIDEILETNAAKENLNASYALKHHTALYSAAVKYFGSWKSAVIAAGLEYDKINLYVDRERWSKEKVINRILELNEKGESLNLKYVETNYSSLSSAAFRCFGGWKNAIKAAGLDYGKILEDAKRKRIEKKKWSKNKIVEKIQELHKRGEDLSHVNMKATNSALVSAAFSKNYFGSWENAIQSAGLDYNKIRKEERWGKETVLDKIFRLHQAEENLNAKYIHDNYSSLHWAAGKYFGSWKNAITEAGLDYETINLYSKWSKQKIIDEILKLYESGEKLNHAHVNKIYPALTAAALSRNHFGSWRKALEAAGLDYDEVRESVGIKKTEEWSKEKIVDEILELYNSGEDLNANNMRKVNIALYGAAVNKRYFGSWEKAIEAVGLDYDEIKRYQQWDKQKIIDEILRLHEAGEDLSYMNIREDYRALVSAAFNYFGNWENAISALGLDYEKIRLDYQTEAYKGFIFQKILKEIFKIINKEVSTNKRYYFDGEICIPDFVDKNTGVWIDAKLNSWGRGIEETAHKYLKYVDKLIIYYLTGGVRKWDGDKVIFRDVNDFYPNLIEVGRQDIIRDLSLIERGIVPSKYQKGLEDYFKRRDRPLNEHGGKLA
ncbi:MAG: hypothetical protein ACTSX0_11465 [Promethearchaeota archaeon]